MIQDPNQDPNMEDININESDIEDISIGVNGSNKTNLQRLREIVAGQLGLKANKIRPDANFGKELGADSLDIVELVMSIEDEFDIEIEDTAASQIATIQDALDYIEEHCQK